MNCPVCKKTELITTDLDQNLTSLSCPDCGGNCIRRRGILEVGGTYAEIKRVRWWLDTRNNREELLAYLIDRDPYAA